jgi:putative spermidine/putrescine transport system substrate-binding protein
MKRSWTIRCAAGALSASAILAVTGMAAADSMDGLVAAARKEGQLTVMALPRDWCGYGDIIDGFKAKYGLAVSELNPDASSHHQLEAIEASRDTAGPEAPDVIDVGLSFGPSAKKDGLLQPYKVSTWSTIPDAAKDADGYWYGDYYGVLAFEINADIVTKPPADWPDLLTAEYRNSVALAGNPLVSNQGVLGVFAAGLSAADGRVDQAADRGLRFLAELQTKGNFVPVVGATGSLVEGDTPILIRWDYLGLGDRDRLAGKPKIEVVVPKTGVVAGVYVQAISAFAPHPNAAKLWMEYLYSDEGQLAFLNGYCHPIRFKDLTSNRKVPVKLLEKLPQGGNGVTYGDPVFPTVEEQERAREIITNGWDAIVGVDVLKHGHSDVPSQ